MITNLLLVMVGGALGSGLRYGVSLLMPSQQGMMPWPTLVVNTIGSFVIGVLWIVASSKSTISPHLVLFIGVGLCGGFTTFSTFALDTVVLYQHNVSLISLLYVVLSTCGGIVSVIIGMIVARWFLSF